MQRGPFGPSTSMTNSPEALPVAKPQLQGGNRLPFLHQRLFAFRFNREQTPTSASLDFSWKRT
jgi:hypothetical protein